MSASTSSTSLIRHPASSPFVMVRTEYMRICEDSPDNRICAMLLHVFEQWANWKHKNRSQAEEHNQREVKSGNEATQDTGMWIYKTYANLQEDILGFAGINKISDCMSWLVDTGYLQRRNNPRHAWDRTYQYRLNITSVQQAIDATIPNVNPEVLQDLESKTGALEPKNQSVKSKEAIPQNTDIEDNTEKEKDDDPRARKDTLPEKTDTSNAVVSDGQMLLETNWGTFALEDLRLIENDLEHHGLDAVQAAIVTAKDNNASTYRYASKILANGSGKANISAPAREILDAWKDATGTLEANIERHAPTAHNIAAAGYTPDDIARYVASLKKEDFWKAKAIPLDYIARNIAAWQRTPRGSASTDGLSSVPMVDDLPDMEPERPPVWKPAEHETENF